eukprot:UN26579
MDSRYMSLAEGCSFIQVTFCINTNTITERSFDSNFVNCKVCSKTQTIIDGGK